jgi:demethylmenaquinone methyltransferase/2-methoxy-6-polyprenyl-1,4-benzoquinol methylase
MAEPSQVRSMFARIAGRYDLLNRLLSAGMDRRWRAAALEVAGDVRDRCVVDACCGTGDLTLVFARAGANAVGVDFTPEMLERARPKLEHGTHAVFATGDALLLPIRDAVADVCSVAFGIRNVADRVACLGELYRVTRPGGRVIVLEFTMPPGAILGRLYRLYFTRILPAVGRLVSGDDDAYTYLSRTVLAWPAPPALQREMEEVGFVECGHRLLTRGVCCLHWGTVPATATQSAARGEGGAS